ncbi:peptidoglycan-binding protein [Denitrobaculum tricleocarpae]|uniref:PASTA domain-containing protein n=1 Tax=Denitrobaculum tricleocarpae TaxID=2591009 RepID=A0A545TMC5_9PROT|nr:peptidoglycan-binding protein [Denitrobaculum tricleocarpae]TQV78336.1 PASTA domain-containing protein [Denitrobaculum tricleocarpae]
MTDQKVNRTAENREGTFKRRFTPSTAFFRQTRAAAVLTLGALVIGAALIAKTPSLSAQNINWTDPQSPLLKAVVTHQRIANEQEVGNILVMRGGRPFAGVTRMTLVAGDSLITGDQTAIIGYADQSWEAVVHPNTQVDFKGGEIKVAFGRMFVQLTPSEQKLLPISVTSNYGTVTAGKASFEIDVSEERAVITVIAGTMDLARPKSEIVKLQALDEAVLVSDAPVVTRPISTDRFAKIGSRIATLSNLGVVSSGVESLSPQESDLAEGTPESEGQSARNKTAQSLLNALGYDAGPADGVAGPRTLRAVAAFRLDQKLPGTTEIDEALITALRAESPPPPTAPQVVQAAPEPQRVQAPQAQAPQTEAPQTETTSKTPDVTRLDFDKARLMLIQSEQLIGRVTYEVHEDVAPGTVLRQLPAPGQATRRNLSVDLVVSRAPSKSTQTGATATEADATGTPVPQAVPATAVVSPPPPPPAKTAAIGSQTDSEIAAAEVEAYLGAKGYLGTQDEVISLFRPEQKLDSVGPVDANVLSRDELSACLRIEDDYLAQKLRAGTSSQKQDATADEIAALDVQLDETLPKTDPDKPETLEVYNRLLDKRHRLFAEYKDKILPEARQNDRALKALERSFQADCGQRPYRADDLEAARKKASLIR